MRPSGAPAGSVRRPVLSVVILAWGEEHNIPALLPGTRKTLDALGDPHEILVSAFEPDKELERLCRDQGATLIRAPRPGYGELLRAALQQSGGAYVLTMDGDFSHRPGYIRTMWSHRHSGEVLVASRYVRASYAELGLTRRMLSRLLNLIYRKALSLPYRDLSSGFRMFPRRTLEDIGLPRGKGLDVLPEMIATAVSQGWKVVEVPFWYRGASPWNRARMVRLGIGFMKTLVALFGLRNSVRSADYDSRAFDSWIPLQRHWQRRRFRIVQSFVSEADFVLDVGCGTSRIIQTLPNVVGLDIALRKLRWIRAAGRMLVQGSILGLPFRDRSFDGVICSEVIEHVPKGLIRLDELVRVIRPGGVLVLGTPDYGKRMWRALEWIYDRVYPGGYTGEHINPYTHEGLRRELEGLGLHVMDCRYVGRAAMIFKARVPATAVDRAPADSADVGIVAGR